MIKYLNKFSRSILQLMLATIFCITVNHVYAQKELWGTVQTTGNNGDGYLFRTNTTGDNLLIVHHFLSATSGRLPSGEFIQASNRKLYGLTIQGGLANNGTLYEYDLTIDSLRTLVSFDTLSFPPYTTIRPDNGVSVGLIEAMPGVLYGQFNIVDPSVIFSYTIATGQISIVAAIPNPLGPNFIRRPMYKASDGFIYAATHNHSLCGSSSPRYNSIIRIDPATNTLTTLYKNPCSPTGGLWCSPPMIEANATEWYGVAEEGGNADKGTIFSFNPTTNAYTKKYDFPGDVDGGGPSLPLIKANNGKIYGTALYGAPDPPNVPGGSGVIFEYDPVTNVYQKKFDFRYGNGSSSLVGTDGILKLKGTNGKLYGIARSGLFEYDVTTNTTRAAGRFGVGMRPSSYGTHTLIEICRPPAYRYYPVRTYTKCEGESFHLDLQCANATSIVWKHNNVVDPSRTTSVLDFTSIAPSDTGTWVCELSNECGTTMPPAIRIKFNTVKPLVIQNNIILNAPAADNYQWLNCQNNYLPLENEIAQTFNVSENGQYAVIITNGICVDTSTCYTINITSVQEMLAQESLSLYPNPASDKLELQAKGDIRILSVQVMALTGETVITAASNTSIDVTGLTSGLYFLSVQTSKGNWKGKFIKR